MKFGHALGMSAAFCGAFGVSTPAISKAATAGPAIRLACSGPAAVAARKIAVREKLALATDPKACLALASMYGGSSKQMIVAVPSAECAPKKAIMVYERSNSGLWGSILEKPVCGTTVAFGPNDPWGAIMITIDGRHYDQRGAYYTPANY